MLAALIDTRTARDYLLYLGAIVLVAGGVMIWAVVFRKTGQTRRRHRHHRSHPADADSESDAAPRRRRRREPRRNPTRAEVGGLPPLRDQAGPSSPSEP